MRLQFTNNLTPIFLIEKDDFDIFDLIKNTQEC